MRTSRFDFSLGKGPSMATMRTSNLFQINDKLMGGSFAWPQKSAVCRCAMVWDSPTPRHLQCWLDHCKYSAVPFQCTFHMGILQCRNCTYWLFYLLRTQPSYIMGILVYCFNIQKLILNLSTKLHWTNHKTIPMITKGCNSARAWEIEWTQPELN